MTLSRLSISTTVLLKNLYLKRVDLAVQLRELNLDIKLLEDGPVHQKVAERFSTGRAIPNIHDTGLLESLED